MSARILASACVLAAVIASAPARAESVEVSSWLDYGEVLEDQDGPSPFDADMPEVGDDHPIIRRAQSANPGKAIVVCMAGCGKGSGGAVYADPMPAKPVRPAMRKAMQANPDAASGAQVPVVQSTNPVIDSALTPASAPIAVGAAEREAEPAPEPPQSARLAAISAAAAVLTARHRSNSANP